MNRVQRACTRISYCARVAYVAATAIATAPRAYKRTTTAADTPCARALTRRHALICAQTCRYNDREGARGLRVRYTRRNHKRRRPGPMMRARGPPRCWRAHASIDHFIMQVRISFSILIIILHILGLYITGDTSHNIYLGHLKYN